MNISKVKSYNRHHYLDISGTKNELHNCHTWCIEQFGSSTFDTWFFTNAHNPQYKYRVFFSNIEYSGWFTLRWT